MLPLIPKPASIQSLPGTFSIPNQLSIRLEPSNSQMLELGNYFASVFASIAKGQIEGSGIGQVQFSLKDDPGFGAEGYELKISAETIQISANHPAGIFYGIQTLRQLIQTAPSGTSRLPAVSIRDLPRFEWRGAMLDVARHFFGVEDIKRYIDLISHYKMNRLHLHLTDDQGWRIEIKSWPRLTQYGAQTQVNGGGGGFYTQEQFKEIVEYARSRFVMIIPEIDTPGHTNAALASYAELNTSEEAPALYEGTEVGFSSLSIHLQVTYQFLEDVIRELASISPAPYIHIGGDEARSTPEEDYKIFIKRFQDIVFNHGKIPVGWAEIGEAELDPRTIAQLWFGPSYQNAKKQGCKIILSPANKTYLDMKYDESSPLGLNWAGYISIKDAYDWEPGTYMEGLEESDILGIEAPLWSETLITIKDIEYMAFPRLPGLAELSWSPKGQIWDEYKERLTAHVSHMETLGINFFRHPDLVTNIG